MNKEKITFIVGLAILALIYFGGGDESSSTRRRKSRRKANTNVAHAEPVKASFLGDEASWNLARRSVYRAPRKTEPLPPIPILPPPLTRLPHPGLPLRPVVGKGLRAAMRRPVDPDPSIKLPEPSRSQGSLAFGIDAAEEVSEEETTPGEGEPVVSVEPKAEEQVGPVTLSQLLRMSTVEIEQLRQKEEEARETKKPTALARVLDYVIWPNGQKAFGEITARARDDDRFDLKIRYDGIKGDAALDDLQRRRKLSELRFVFRESRGGQLIGRTELDGSRVADFALADSPRNRFELGIRRAKEQGKANDLERIIALHEPLEEAGELELLAQSLETFLKEEALQDASSYALLANAYEGLYRYGDAFRVVKSAREKAPDDVELQVRQASLFVRLGLPEAAVSAYRDALQKKPGHGRASLGLGALLVERGDGAGALPHLRAAESAMGLKNEELQRARLLIGCARLLEGEERPAASSFQTVLDQVPDHAGACAGLAVTRLVSKDAKGALGIVERARSTNSLHGGLAYLEAVCHLELGDWVKARDTLMLVPELDPMLTGLARVGMSFLMEKQGKDADALTEINQALVADPGNRDASLIRARLLVRVGDLQGAREAFELVLSADPRRADVLAGLGDVAFREGNFDEAIRYFDRVAELDASFPDILGRRVMVEARRGRLAKAQEHLKGLSTQQLADPYLQACRGYMYYLLGNARETIDRCFADLKESKDASADLREYAATNYELILDNLGKQQWRDTFDRSGTDLLRGWKREIGSGIGVALAERSVLFRGRQTGSSFQPTVLYQERDGREVTEFSAQVRMQPRPGVFSGIGMVGFSRGSRGAGARYEGMQERGGRSLFCALQLALTPDQGLCYRVIKSSEASKWIPLPDAQYQGGTATFGLRRSERKKNAYEVVVNGRVVNVDPIDCPQVARSTKLELQVFTQASLEQPVDFSVDDVTIVTQTDRRRR